MPLGERPRRLLKVDANMERRIVRKIRKNPFGTSAELTSVVNVGLSAERRIAPSTLKTYAIKNCLISRRPAIKHQLTSEQAKAHWNFAREYMTKDMRYWSRVLFTDETQVLLNPVDRHEMVRRPRHERNNTRYVVQKPKFDGGRIMFWGSINLHGTGTLIKVDGRIKVEAYIEMLNKG